MRLTDRLSQPQKIVIVIALVGFIVWRSHAGDPSKDPSTFQYDVY